MVGRKDEFPPLLVTGDLGLIVVGLLHRRQRRAGDPVATLILEIFKIVWAAFSGSSSGFRESPATIHRNKKCSEPWKRGFKACSGNLNLGGAIDGRRVPVVSRDL